MCVCECTCACALFSCGITVYRLKGNFVLTDFCLKLDEETDNDYKESHEYKSKSAPQNKT